MNNPVISVVVPVSNVENYLEESLACIKNQSFEVFEVICVDDGSTDSSVDIVKKYIQEDERFILVQQKNQGAGAARNKGLNMARGEYIIFLHSDVIFSPKLLEKSYNAAVACDADIVAFDFNQFDNEGNKCWLQGVHSDWLGEEKEVFNYKDCPDLIMSIINPTSWNKLYRRSFIIENGLQYEEISTSNDITFAAVSVACAERITYIHEPLVDYRIGHAGTVTSGKLKNMHNVVLAVSSAVEKAKQLPYADEIEHAIQRFAIDNYIYAYKRSLNNFEDFSVQRYYEYIHEYFQEEEFQNLDVEKLHNERLWRDFCTVKQHDYNTMKKLLSRKIVVSLTSYPARINGIAEVLESVYIQTRPADEVVLWLAEEQFPDKEKELPIALQKLIENNKLTVKWCDDLKPHKKYFYALQEYSDSLVITIDDDLTYPPYTFENLYQSYLLYPNAVSAGRAHLMIISEKGNILPYEYWIKETDVCLYKPSMQLLATGCAGVLYPPGIFSPELFNKEAIIENCLWADDLWLKVMELLSDVPVVVAQPFSGLHYLPGSQETALCHQNVDQNQNDIQLMQVMKWLDAHYGEGILIEKLTKSDIGESFLGVEMLCKCFSNERKLFRKNTRALQRKLQRTYQEKSEINAKLQQTYREKSEINAKLQQTYREKSEINAKLRQTHQEKLEINAKLQQTYQGKLEINAKLQQTYQEKSEINAKLQQAYQEKSEINAKLKQTYKEKAERGVEIKDLQQENTALRKQLDSFKKSYSYKLYKLFKKLKNKLKQYLKAE